jgi:ribulose-phosphate 3-epimerase
MPETLGKISAARQRAPHLNIIVDGGINPETGRRCVEAGANVLVAGNSLFRHKKLDLAGAIKELRANAN